MNLAIDRRITNAIVEAYNKALRNELFTIVQIDSHGDLCHKYKNLIYNQAYIK
jgi:arginase family enzyme